MNLLEVSKMCCKIMEVEGTILVRFGEVYHNSKRFSKSSPVGKEVQMEMKETTKIKLAGVKEEVMM